MKLCSTMNQRAVNRARIMLAAAVVFAVPGCAASQNSAVPGSGPASHAQFQHWRSQLRRTLFVPQPLPRLDPHRYGRFSPATGIVADRVTYGTEFGMRVPAIVYHPAAHDGRLPALIVVNGHGGDKYSWYSFYTGILYARAGAVVLTYDPIGEGERNPERRSGTRLHDRVVNAPHYPERLSGLMITDVMQAVSYLRQRKDVDPSRVAVLGYSMGSFVSALTGAVDPRISALVLSGGGDLDSLGGYWENSGKPMCQAIPWKALSVLGDKAAVIYALNQLRGPTLIMNGTRDTVVDIPGHHEQPFFDDLAWRAEAITGTNQNIFETYWVHGASHRPSWITRPAALWLQDRLHFPDWTVQSINDMPQTHISAWAAANHAPIDKAYSSEEREGGIMALGSGVPNIPRADLDVLTDSEWQRQKGRFVYGAWVQHALAAEGIAGSAAKGILQSGASSR